MSEPITPLKYEDGQIYQSTIVDPFSQYSHLKTGWEHNAYRDLTWTVNEASRTLTLESPTNDEEYWINGARYVLDSPVDFIWDDTEGTWFLYLTANSAVTTQTPWDFTADAAYVASVYWDATNNEIVVWAPETHSWHMSYPMQEWAHQTFGCTWAEGLLATIVTGNTTMNVSQGELHDQLLEAHITDDIGIGSIHDMTLTPLTTITIYRDGSDGDWRKTASTNVPSYLIANVPQYNTWNGTDWVLQDVDVNKYFCDWLIGSTSADTPLYWMLGQAEGDSLSDIQARSWTDLTFGDLPSQEHKVLAKVIMQRQNNSPYYTIVEIEDLRRTSDYGGSTGGGSTGGTSDHGSLTGLGDDDHKQYVLVDGSRAFTGNVTAPGIGAATGNLDITSPISLAGNHIFSGDVYFDIGSSDSFVVNTGNNTVVSAGSSSAIISGANNTMNGNRSVIAGGYFNNIVDSINNAAVIGGEFSAAYKDNTAILGGASLTANGEYAVAVGGQSNDITGNHSVAVGGQSNDVIGDTCVSVSGYLNAVNGSLTATIGGQSNTITANSSGSVIVGSIDSTVNGNRNSVVGGDTNNVTGNTSVILGGNTNNVTAESSAILGGENNAITGNQSAIIGGQYNSANEFFEAILGGEHNEVNSRAGVAFGRYAVNDHWASMVNSGGQIAEPGDSQVIRCHLSNTTINNATADLYLDGPTGNESLVMPERSMWLLRAWVIGCQNFGSMGGAFVIWAALRRDGSSQPIHNSGASPSISALSKSHPGYNAGVAIRSGAVVAITVQGQDALGATPYEHYWSAYVEITQVRVSDEALP